MPLNQLLQQKLALFLCVCWRGRDDFAPKSKDEFLITICIGKLGRHFDTIVPVFLKGKFIFHKGILESNYDVLKMTNI